MTEIALWIAFGYLAFRLGGWTWRNRHRTLGDIATGRHWCGCGDEVKWGDPYWKRHGRCANCCAAHDLEIN